MECGSTVRVANSREALERLLAEIEGTLEAGSRRAPDWIHIQGSCRIDELPLAELETIVQRLHRCVLRGFRTRPLPASDPRRRLAVWRCIARNGFHDFGSQGFTKCYDSPWVESYDYVADYLDGGLQALDAYRVYSAVLGTHDYTIEDFLHTPTCEKVETVVEPMAGTGEFSYLSHFRHPELRYILFDLDETARRKVLERPWRAGSEADYLVADVLDPAVWRDIGRRGAGPSLAYIGKQSHHFFDAPQLHRLLDLGTSHVDHFILETPEPALVSDLAVVDEMTRPEMEDAGFEVALVEDEACPPNPFTNRLGFRLEAWDARERRVLFEYRDWTSWQPPMLVVLARLLDLEVLYLNDDAGDFVPVDACTLPPDSLPGSHPPAHLIDHAEAQSGVNFMLFRKRR